MVARSLHANCSRQNADTGVPNAQFLAAIMPCHDMDCFSAWQRGQVTCETTMIQGETLLQDGLDFETFAYFDEQTAAHFGYWLRYIVFVVECCRLQTAVFNDADRFLNNGAAKSCVLLALMVSRQSFMLLFLVIFS